MRFNRYTGMAFAGLLTLGLAACEEGVPRVVEMSQNDNGTRTFLAQAVQKGPILVSFFPRNVAATGFEERTIEVMNDNAAQPVKTIFTSNRGQAWDQVQVIYWFGAPKSRSGRDLCGGPAPDISERDGKEIKIIGVLCQGNKLEAEAHGWIASDTAAEDEPYRQLIGSFTKALFKPPITRN